MALTRGLLGLSVLACVALVCVHAQPPEVVLRRSKDRHKWPTVDIEAQTVREALWHYIHNSKHSHKQDSDYVGLAFAAVANDDQPHGDRDTHIENTHRNTRVGHRVLLRPRWQHKNDKGIDVHEVEMWEMYGAHNDFEGFVMVTDDIVHTIAAEDVEAHDDRIRARKEASHDDL